MSSRLQVGGLALVVGHSTITRNLGKVVRLERYIGEATFNNGDKWNDCWAVTGDDLLDADLNIKRMLYSKASWLMPLGDEKGIEIYKLKEELTCNN